MHLTAVQLRVRQWARSNGLRAAWVAVMVGLLAGSVLIVAGGARRTASLPDRYTAAIGGDPDLVLYQYAGAPLTDAIRGLPGVADAHGATFTAAWPITDDFEAVRQATNPFAGSADAFVGLIVDGRYADPGAPDEFTVNRPLAELLHAEVGDEIAIAAFDSEQTADPGFDGTGTPGIDPFRATLVGITAAAGEFEDATPTIMYSGAMLAAHPDIGVVASFILVDLDPGIDANDVLAAARQLPGGEGLQRPPDAQQVSADVRRGVHYVALSLWIVAGVTSLGAVVVIALLVSQIVGATAEDRRTLRAIGWGRRDFLAESLVESAVIAVVAIVIASTLVITTSRLFPFGASRTLEPNPGVRVDAVVVALGMIGVLLICTLAALANELIPTRSRPAVDRRRLSHASSRPFWSLPMVVGVRFALEPSPRHRTAWTSLAPGVIGCIGLVGAMTVGFSMAQVVDEPARWGLNFDNSFGNEWLAQDVDIVTPALDDPDVQQLTVATVGTVSIDDIEVQVLAFDPVRGSLVPETLDGRVPVAADEVGLGGEVARTIGKDIGDTVQADGPAGDRRELTIVGIVMTPNDAGGGAAMTYDGYKALVADATKNLLLVDFADDARPGAPAALAAATSTPVDFSPLLPTSIGSLQRVVPIPYLLAAILSFLGAAATVQALSASVRDRRRDLGTMRALGAVSGQLRGVLHWQSTTTAAVVLTLGTPVGLLLGRQVFAAVADSIGVDPTPQIAWALLPVLVGLVLLITNAAALLPGIRASRAPALDLVTER